jgi:hypothetical protein
VSLERGRAYGVTMPFAYDNEDDRVIMDLGFAKESEPGPYNERLVPATGWKTSGASFRTR